MANTAHLTGAIEMKPSLVFLALVVISLAVAQFMVPETLRLDAEAADGAKTTERVDRSRAVEIARQMIDEDKDPEASRAIFDARPSSDGGWTVSVRWYVDGESHTEHVAIDKSGNIVQYVR
jgi:hypothetical protein